MTMKKRKKNGEKKKEKSKKEKKNKKQKKKGNKKRHKKSNKSTESKKVARPTKKNDNLATPKKEFLVQKSWAQKTKIGTIRKRDGIRFLKNENY